MTSLPPPTGSGPVRNTLTSSANVLPQLGHLGLDTIGVLGEGGMGVVYRVRDRRLRRDAALKLIRSAGAAVDPRAINRFRREVLVTAQLDHPGIPPVYDSGTDPQGQPYMLMRVVEGRPLSDIIKEHHEDFGGELSERELVEVVLRVAEAIAYAHTQGIVHRDLKPANVMVGRFGEVLVMDWGLARELGKTDAEDAAVREEVATSRADEAAESGMTLQGAVVGTPGYMPPEQAEGNAVDERADVFALGALLCCVLTGRPPIQGQTSVNRLVATLQGRISAPRELKPDVPRELNAIAVAALAEEANDRTPTVLHFMRDLRAYLAGSQVGAYRYSLRERTLSWLRRRVALLAVGVGGLLLVGGLGAAALIIREVRGQAAADQLRTEAEAREAEAAARTLAEANRRVQRAMTLLSEADELARRSGSSTEIRAKVDEALELVRERFTRNQAARIHELAGDVERAKELLEVCVKDYPPAYRELFALHRLELEGKEQTAQEGATEPLQRLRDLAIARGDENEFTLFTRAQEARIQGDLPRALALYTKAIERYPRFVWALSNRATILLMLNRPEQALKDATLAAKIDPRFTPAVANQGVAHMQLNRPEEALRYFGIALALKPNLARAHILRAKVELALHQQAGKKGAPTRALRDLRRGLELDPDDALGLCLRGVILLEQRQLDQALRDLNRSIRSHKSMEALANRGMLHVMKRDWPAAERDLAEALTIAPKGHPGRPKIEQTLGQVREKLAGRR